MCTTLPVLIVITDELGSTSRDEKIRRERDENTITEQNYKNQLLESRKELFVKQIKGLTQPEKSWTVVKTIGDSLIIRFVPQKESFEEGLIKCLYTLAEIWKSFKGQIRVACHLTYFEDIVINKDIYPLKKALEDLNDEMQVTLNPVSDSIQWDMFGSAMNKAARLVSIPVGGLFVVSQEVMEKISTSEYLQREIIPKRVPFELKLSTGKMIGWAYPVPVVNLKGFAEEYTNPWYVWEIVPRRSRENGDEGKQNRIIYRNLRVQFKEFQSIKIVVANYKSALDPDDKDPPLEKEACECFERTLQDNPCPLFVDFAFRIKNVHQLFEPNMRRDFDYQLQKVKETENGKEQAWHDVLQDIKGKGDLIPHYVMFTSVPDIQTNKKLRRFFTPEDESKNKTWTFQHISFDIYESLRIEYKEKKCFKGYFLLLFQIQKRYADEADDWKQFFKERKNPLLFTLPVDHTYPHTIIAHGLVRGEIDGFVLLGTDATKDSMGKLEKYIQLSITQEKFFNKTAPIFLYDLELLSPFPFMENINDLTIVRDIHDKEK